MNELSGRLGVNANTVVKAYRDLSVVGILYSLRGKGVFVKDGANEASEAWCRSRIVARTFEVVCEGKAAGMSKSEIRSAVKACLAAKSSPYGEVPKGILDLGKK